MLVLRKVKQLLSNFEAERWENLSNLRLAKKSVAYKKNSSVANAKVAKLKVQCGPILIFFQFLEGFFNTRF